MRMAALKQGARIRSKWPRSWGQWDWLSAGSWLLQRSRGAEAGRRIFGRTKSECSQQRKSHDQREEEEVLFSHLSPPLGRNPKSILSAQNIT